MFYFLYGHTHLRHHKTKWPVGLEEEKNSCHDTDIIFEVEELQFQVLRNVTNVYLLSAFLQAWFSSQDLTQLSKTGDGEANQHGSVWLSVAKNAGGSDVTVGNVSNYLQLPLEP